MGSGSGLVAGDAFRIQQLAGACRATLLHIQVMSFVDAALFDTLNYMRVPLVEKEREMFHG